MLIPRFALAISTVGAMVLGGVAAYGQDFPSKPIRIVTSEPGGGNDFTSRLIVQGLAGGSLGQAVVVENRPTVIAPEIVVKAAPDGYTLYVAGSSFIIGHLLQEKPYDPATDFSPVTWAGVAPNIAVVHPSLPVKSIHELIALAKVRSGELNYATSGIGSASNLAAELFKSMAGVAIVAVSYKGSGPAVIGLVGGEVQVMFDYGASLTPHIKSGKLRALAITSAKPSVLFPGLPTVAASGVPGYESVAMSGVFAPAKTPAAIINRLNQEIVRALNRGDVKEKFFNSGVEVVGSSPEELANKMKSEIAKWDKVIRTAGLRAR